MIHGSCLCQQVKYQIKAIGNISHCHCQTCRKAHGTAFSSVAAVHDADFTIEGIEHLKSFESSSGKYRYFCHHCGSQIFAKRENTQHIILRLGTLDSNIDASEVSHIWLSQKANWYQLNNQLHEYPEFEDN